MERPIRLVLLGGAARLRRLLLPSLVLLALLGRRRPAGVTCQGHFRPIAHPYAAAPRTLAYPQLMQRHVAAQTSRGLSLASSLGGRGQSYINQMVQQHRFQHHQNQQQQQQQHHQQHRQQQRHQSSGYAPVSDRRASSPTSAASQLLTVSASQQHQVPLAAFKMQEPLQSSQQQQQQQRQAHAETSGKLLICYYTTKQMAPYWPKDAREFVVPADRLSQVVSSFAPDQLREQHGGGRYSTPIGQQGAAPPPPSQQQQQRGAQGNPLAPEASRGHAQEMQSIGGARHAHEYSLAGGPGLVLVAPKFVPFNRTTTGALQDAPVPAASGELATDARQAPGRPVSSFAQMFFMPNNEQRHNTIASRHDNAASLVTTGATNQPPHRHSPALATAPHTTAAQLIVANNDDGGLRVGGGDGGIVFDKSARSKHDLSSKRNSEPGLATIANEATSPQAKTNLPQQQATLLPSPVLFGDQNNGATATASLAIRQPPAANNANNRELYQPAERSAHRQQQQQQQQQQVKHQQQQLIYTSSPPMSRTFIVGASVGAPLVTSGGLGDNQDPAAAQSVPLVNADTGDYYHYYYNQPSGGGQQARAGGPASVSSPAAATTVSLATAAYQSLQRQSAGGGGGLQKGKSLQVAESELSPALPLSSLAPITFVEGLSVAAPPTYSIGGIHGAQGPLLERLTVSSGPSLATLGAGQQRYAGGPGADAAAATASTSRAHPTGLAASHLLKASGDDDGLISSGTKTTPIASEASLGSPGAAAFAASEASQQLVATLPAGGGGGGLLIAYPASSASLAPPAQTPNGSSTGTTAAASSAQLSAGGGAAVSASPDAESNNRHHQPPSSPSSSPPPSSQQQQQQQHSSNNRQIVGVGGSSLSAALVSSPLSTMFDVFGAASQYLMRFKPSSLISPSSFASLNSIVGDSSNNHQNYDHHHLHQNQNSRSNSSSSSLSALSFSGGGGGGGGGLLGSSGPSPHKSNGSQSGFQSRLSLQSHQRREDICGRTIQLPERRIIGGEGAKYGEFPYQVHIKIAKHQCGGALIDKQSIVTAAHCVYHFITRAPVSKLQIVIGAYDIEDEQYQELPPQYFKVNKVKLHPNFRFSASHPDRYDIAILKLDKPVKYTDNVLPVCLPTKELKYENMVGTVTGFGKTDPSLSNRYGTRLLQKVDVPIIENGECERWHRTRGIDLKIFPEMMCAGYEDGLKDACVGDSGGPLVIKTPAGPNGSFRWTLAGITSAGFGCAQSRQPGIYHRVSHTVDWILDNLD